MQDCIFIVMSLVKDNGQEHLGYRVERFLVADPLDVHYQAHLRGYSVIGCHTPDEGIGDFFVATVCDADGYLGNAPLEEQLDAHLDCFLDWMSNDG